MQLKRIWMRSWNWARVLSLRTSRTRRPIIGLIGRIQRWSKSIGGVVWLIMTPASVPEVGPDSQHPVWPGLQSLGSDNHRNRKSG